MTIFDIGGSVGVHYHAYQKIMSYPTGVRWSVCETPEIAAVGREIAQQTLASDLIFTDTFDSTYLDSDIWLAAGSLQYIEHGQILSLLDRCQHKPTHIILNKLPMYDGEDFVSTQNLGKGCYSPFYVYNKRRFIENLIPRGYEVVDTWTIPERDLYLPGYPKRSFSSFTGIYFKLKTGLSHRR
jgi:putative methyltransferase (TIGR04325 family)